MPSRLFSVAPSFVPPVHPSFMLSLPIDASLKKLNRSLNISRVFSQSGERIASQQLDQSSPRQVACSFLLLLIKFLTLGCCANLAITRYLQPGKTLFPCTMHWHGNLDKLG